MRALRVALASVLVAACTTAPLENGTCQPTGEIGNYGCTVVAGQVTEVGGQPVTNAIVGAVGASINSEVVQTDSLGDYVAVVELLARPPGDTSSTSAIWVRATVPPPAGSDQLQGRKDSVAVTVHWTPIGGRPDTLRVPDIVLPPP